MNDNKMQVEAPQNVKVKTFEIDDVIYFFTVEDTSAQYKVGKVTDEVGVVLLSTHIPNEALSETHDEFDYLLADFEDGVLCECF